MSISRNPSSFISTTNVATQGKYIVRTTEAVTNCPIERPRGASIPMATSFLKNPIRSAAIAADGRPRILDIIGPKILERKSIIPREYKRLTIKTPIRTKGNASFKNQ